MNRIRSEIEGVFKAIASLISRTGLKPNTITLSSLIIAIIGYISIIYTKSGILLGVFILLSGLLDALDGALARLSRLASKKGALLDSLVDRLCEIVFSLSFIELGFDPRLVLVFLSGSMLTSYTRARGESLGLMLSGVGLMERAERLIILALVSFIHVFNVEIALYMYISVTLLVYATVIHRFNYIWRNL
ncbi:MAG: archaetidylinositol phosphate synthase [Desulfurococcaceae archaeon]